MREVGVTDFRTTIEVSKLLEKQCKLGEVLPDYTWGTSLYLNSIATSINTAAQKNIPGKYL